MEITQTDFNQFRQFLEKYSGILLADNKQYLVISRLKNFIVEKGFNSFSQFLQQLQQRPQSDTAMQAIELMATNETLWFRDNYPFDCLSSCLFPTWKNFSRIRILCAACSSGQEPYSIAILLHKAGLLSRTEILATDISHKVLQQAKSGFYQQLEIKRGLQQQDIDSYFSYNKESDGWQLNQKIIDSVKFKRLNLIDIPYHLGKFDLIFCRNVLIYFSKQNKTAILNQLASCLNSGGYMFLGASEALTDETVPLKVQRCNPGIAYFK